MTTLNHPMHTACFRYCTECSSQAIRLFLRGRSGRCNTCSYSGLLKDFPDHPKRAPGESPPHQRVNKKPLPRKKAEGSGQIAAVRQAPEFRELSRDPFSHMRLAMETRRG